MRVNGDEGTPVPIPNTVVKLVYGDNTWLATARKDNSTRTSIETPIRKGRRFVFVKISSILWMKPQSYVTIGLSMLRVLMGIPIYWMLIPGYALALGLTFLYPESLPASPSTRAASLPAR